MNAVEIEEAISELAAEPFDRGEFVFEFLRAFGNNETRIRRLKRNPNTDIPEAILQKNNIHIATCDTGQITQTLNTLREHPKTTRNKCKFIVATDGEMFEAEDMNTGEHVACPYPEFADQFGFFLPLAGISTVSQIKNNPIDIRATRHLNKLYIALLQDNPEWATAERRHDLNQFMSRLIFCFFAEDTGIFFGEDLFTKTVMQMSEPGSSNTHDVIGELFRAMDTPLEQRTGQEVKSWANQFPYVNGGLFKGNREAPRFSKMARATLLAAGGLKWTHINPDIFGSMIQAVADEEERGALGMHYTSVPNIMKVLGPLFLDELNEQLEAAGDNARKLLNLRKRLLRIRVFDPACGSGNFLVIAYIRLREIEHEILKRRDNAGDDPKSVIKLTQFYGIELKSFPSEIARLALLIAEFQCNVRMIGQQEAILDILPLHQTGNIHCGNALRMDWLEVCPPMGAQAAVEEDLAGPTGRLNLDGGDAGDWETYICGNPPYLGSTWQSKDQKDDLKAIFDGRTTKWKSLDYVAGWFMKAADYGTVTNTASAFVSTNSICQGQQVPILWPLVFETGREIGFAHTSFKWANLASHNAGVTVAIVGLRAADGGPHYLYDLDDTGETVRRDVATINAYLVPAADVIVEKASKPITSVSEMDFGGKPADGGSLFLSAQERLELIFQNSDSQQFIKLFLGSDELINGKLRYCLWIEDDLSDQAREVAEISKRLASVREMRQASSKLQTRELACTPHRFAERRHQESSYTIVVPRVSSENREFLPVGHIQGGTIIGDRNFALYDAPLWNMALIASRLHWVWIGTVCVRMRTDFSYSNTLGWNTFPVPKLTQTNKDDLTRCAEDILLAREAHFPATIADLYDPEKMPESLRAAHERNDTVLEEIYIGRRFRNDTERLEKLFDMYTKMTAKKGNG
jgi:hypothetical protein